MFLALSPIGDWCGFQINHIFKYWLGIQGTQICQSCCHIKKDRCVLQIMVLKMCPFWVLMIAMICIPCKVVHLLPFMVCNHVHFGVLTVLCWAMGLIWWNDQLPGYHTKCTSAGVCQIWTLKCNSQNTEMKRKAKFELSVNVNQR